MQEDTIGSDGLTNSERKRLCNNNITAYVKNNGVRVKNFDFGNTKVNSDNIGEYIGGQQWVIDMIYRVLNGTLTTGTPILFACRDENNREIIGIIGETTAGAIIEALQIGKTFAKIGRAHV